MQIKNNLILFICICSSVAFSQGNTFIKSIGSSGYDYGRDIKQDNDTGYVVTGSSSSFGADNGEAFLLKLDVNGDFVWSHNYGGTGSEWGESLVITHDSTYAIAGYSNSDGGAGGFDFYLVRIGEEGVPLWENTYGGSDWDQAFGLVQLPDSGFVMAGESYSFNDGLRHGYMVRTDKMGEVIWEYALTEDRPSFFTDVVIDGDSLIVCGGIGDGGEGTHDGYIYKCHIDGTPGWYTVVGQEHNDYFNAAFAVGGIYSFGGVRGYKFPTEKENFWFYRIEDDGELIIDTTYTNESPESDIVHDIVVRDFDQDYYYVGQTQSYGYSDIDSEPEIFLGKMTLSGIGVTANTYGEAGVDIGYAVDITRDLGGVFLCESDFYSTGGKNLLIIKLNAFWDYPDYLEDIELDEITNSITLEENETFSIYPNPFKTFITIPTGLGGTYSIYGLDGQLIQQNIIANSQIDLSHLDTGVYLFTVQTENGIYSKRLIKN